MKTLHLYLLREVVATLVMTVFIFTCVLLLGNGIREILSLIVNRQATIGLVFHAVALLIPFVLVFALPMGMLTTALLVFGRFSADQELTAARASGLSLVSLISPVVVLSVILSVVCAWLNCEVSPRCHVAYKELIVSAGLAKPGGALQSNQYTPIGRYTIFAGKVESDGAHLQNVMVTEVDEQGDLQRWVKAPRGRILSNSDKQIVLLLEGAYSAIHTASDGWVPGALPETANSEATFAIDIPNRAESARRIGLNDMTFWQLWIQLNQLERASSHSQPMGKLSPAQLQARQKSTEFKADLTMPALVQLHKEVAFSFACIGFTLIGIPLGIRAHRRETSAGVAIALVLVLIYYGFIILGQAWDMHPERAPHLILWIPNFIFQAVGAVMLWRANHGVSK